MDRQDHRPAKFVGDPEREQHHGPEALDLRVYPIVDVLPVHQGIRNDQWSPRIEDLDRRAEIELPNLMKIFIGDEVVELRHLIELPALRSTAMMELDCHGELQQTEKAILSSMSCGSRPEFTILATLLRLPSRLVAWERFVHTRSLLAPLAQANPNDWELPSPPCAQTGGGMPFAPMLILPETSVAEPSGALE